MKTKTELFGTHPTKPKTTHTELAELVSFRDDGRIWGRNEVSWSLHWSDGGFTQGYSPILPIPRIFCQNSPMGNLTATLCLTLAVLLGSAGISWSADFQKGLAAYNSGDYATALRE